METHTIDFGNQQIIFELHRKKVKNINLNVKPDMRVMVSANDRVPLSYIMSFVKDKAPWILKNIEDFKKVQSEITGGLNYISGESVRYLGKQYRLRVREAAREEIKYYRGFIYIYVKDTKDYQRKKLLFSRWIRGKAHLIFNTCLDKMYSYIQKYGVKKPELKIKTMRARWGSCIQAKQRILLNFDLIKAPKYCIEYVVLHELIHFIHNKHNAGFYTFLSVLMPDWKKRKEILDREIIRKV